MRMRIAILSIADKGNLEKERLVLRVRADADVGDYILIQTGFQSDGVTIDTHNTYWFPYKKVEAGDLVVIYTKKAARISGPWKMARTYISFIGDCPNRYGRQKTAPLCSCTRQSGSAKNLRSFDPHRLGRDHALQTQQVVVLERPRLRTPSHNTPRDPRDLSAFSYCRENTVAHGAILEYIARVKNRSTLKCSVWLLILKSWRIKP